MAGPWDDYAESPPEAGPWTEYADAAPQAQVTPKASGNALGDFVLGAAGGITNVAANIGDRIPQALDAVGLNRAAQWARDDMAPTKAGLTKGLAELKERSPIASGAGRLAGEIAATYGPLKLVGGALGAAGRFIPGLAPLGEAVTTSGLRAGGLTGAAGLATRTAGGAISGGLTAGLVDPESAGTGALIGAALPGAILGSGKIMVRAAQVMRGPAASDTTRAAAQAAQDVGFVLPPTQVRPSLANRILEGTAGKISTAQNASARNQMVTNRLARQALGVADDMPLTQDVIQGVRRAAGEPYQSLRGLGEIQADDVFHQALSRIEATQQGAGRSFPGLADNGVTDMVSALRRPSFDAGDAVDAISLLRARADAAYSKGDTIIGKASRGAADALEDALGRAAEASGDPAAIDTFRSARQLIAKTYSVGKAANPATGSVNASKLAGELAKGRPLSGELRQIAQTASAFPKAMQPIERMGSLPQISPLDWIASGSLGAAMHNPLGLLTVGVRPAARAAALSGPVQRGLLASPAAGAAPGLLASPQFTGGLLGLAARGLPLSATGQ